MSMTKIIYCCPGSEPGRSKVKRIIELLGTTNQLEVFHEIPIFEAYIRSYLTHEHLILLHAEEESHLQQFVSLRELLIGHRIILILPDREEKTLARGHSLRPRFMTYVDADFLEMAAVLCRIMHAADPVAMAALKQTMP